MLLLTNSEIIQRPWGRTAFSLQNKALWIMFGIDDILYSPDNTVFSNLGVSESGSLEVLDLWPHLTSSQIEAIVSIVRDCL